MTDIEQMEQRALALLNEVRAEYPLVSSEVASNLALCRAIEQHEAFKREVSDAVTGFDEYGTEAAWERLSRFIIPKPDPLVDALVETFPRANGAEMMAQDLRAAMLARGYEFTKIGEKAGE